ncbi:MAG: SulP family inorganic anion transporter [Nannocystaceae bacterium]
MASDDPSADLRFAADIRAGLVVFLVALPLCLGIAAASEAPPFAGLVAGIVGGVIVGLASGSAISVAGPAAGLTVIVLEGIHSLGFAAFLTATMLAGVLQIAMGGLRMGVLAHFVPNAVIRGMLAAIGLILVLKQIPHAVGYDADYEGDFTFVQVDGQNTFTELLNSLNYLQPGAIIVTILGFLGFFLWRDYGEGRRAVKLTRIAPPHLIVVLLGAAVAAGLAATEYLIGPDHFVRIPAIADAGGILGLWQRPAPEAVLDLAVWQTAAVLAAVASIESLLCVEATDRLDPYHRITPADRELKAQGLGNMVSGFLGGLPVTAVIVRSYANLQAGARTRWAAVIHGVILAVATLAMASLINQIPLAALAVILLIVGGKLTPPALYREMWSKGPNQFLPFIATIVLILVTDLLTGTLLGLGVGVLFVVRDNYRSAFVVTSDGPNLYIRFTANVSFLNKARLKHVFEEAERGGMVIIDGTQARHVDNDILDTITDFQSLAHLRDIKVELKRSPMAGHPFFRSPVAEASAP